MGIGWFEADPSLSRSSDQRLTPRERLRLRRDFSRVFAEKRSAADASLVVHIAENGLTWSRLGISVSSRLGGAVVRNYVKRRIREAFRTNKSAIGTGLDLICVARRKATDGDHDIAGSLIILAARAASASRPRRTGNTHPRRSDEGEK